MEGEARQGCGLSTAALHFKGFGRVNLKERLESVFLSDLLGERGREEERDVRVDSVFLDDISLMSFFRCSM